MASQLSHARPRVHGHTVVATHISLALTCGAGSALDPVLGTRLFTSGLPLGTATTLPPSDRAAESPGRHSAARIRAAAATQR
jgi:hypothetical protein